MGPKLSSWQDVFERLLLLALFLGQARALSQTHCSGQNTGASNFQDTFTYQSNGHCYNECKDKFAFAIVQGKNCWCSNFAPSDQRDTSKCDTTCPGYGYESCGNSDDNLYGYIRADMPISGTLAASTAAKTSAQPIATSVPPITRVDTTTVAVDHTVSELITIIPSPSSSSTSTTPSSTRTSQSSAEPTSSAATTESSTKSESTLSTSAKSSSAVTSVMVVTQGGIVITQTVTSVPGGNSTSASSHATSRNSVSAGQIAGAVVGGLVGVALIVAIATWILLRRRNAQNAGRDENGDGSHPPQRNVSTLSRTGLLKSAERDYSTTLPPINTRHSSNDPSGTDTMTTPMSERRNSRPVFQDPRLNPYPYNVDDGSHASIISIEDNRDYTRTLNVRNPDPPGRDSNDTRDTWEQR